MPLRLANAPALFQELMNKILSMLRCTPVVQELISRGAQMEAHINDVWLGTNTPDHHLILLGEFFGVCKRPCSTWHSTLAIGGGPRRPLRPKP